MTHVPHRIKLVAVPDPRHAGSYRVRPEYVPCYGQTVEPLPPRRKPTVIQPPTFSRAAWLALIAVLVVIAALVSGCEREGLERRTEAHPPSPSVAAPLHPWCPECSGLPSLGTEPRVRRGR